MTLIRAVVLFFSVELLQAAWAQTCQVITADIAFGNYQLKKAGDVKDNANVAQVECDTKNTPYEVQLDPGLHSSGSYFPRRMEHLTRSNQHLEYNIYRDKNGTEVWGDGTSGTFVVQDLSQKAGKWNKHKGFGIAPGLQTCNPGDYHDLITVTVIY